MALARASRGLRRLAASHGAAVWQAPGLSAPLSDAVAPGRWAAGLHGTAAAAAVGGLKDKLALITMPQLAPNMSSGSIRKWLKQPGDAIATYDVVMELDTDNLTEEELKVGDMEGTVTMLVEAQEDGFMGKILVPEGQEVEVHTPVATMCESEEHVDAIQGPEADELLKQPDQLRALTWQCYLKDAKNRQTGGCD